MSISFAKGITPIEAYNIDIKLDDGQPNTGIVQARGTVVSDLGDLTSTNAATSHTAGSEAVGDCTVGTAATDAANTYSRGASAGNAPGCALRMRFN